MSTILMLIAILIWYNYALRIYNRFQWNVESSMPWDKSDNVDPVIDSMNDKTSKTSTNFESYLTMKTTGNIIKDPWERRYVLLRGTHIFYYKDKRSFELDPSKPMNRRPIELEGYSLVAGAVEPPYLITLIPTEQDDIRKSWKFRCDTLNEFNDWIEKFSNALKVN